MPCASSTLLTSWNTLVSFRKSSISQQDTIIAVDEYRPEVAAFVGTRRSLCLQREAPSILKVYWLFLYTIQTGSDTKFVGSVYKLPNDEPGAGNL